MPYAVVYYPVACAVVHNSSAVATASASCRDVIAAAIAADVAVGTATATAAAAAVSHAIAGSCGGGGGGGGYGGAPGLDRYPKYLSKVDLHVYVYKQQASARCVTHRNGQQK